MAVYDGVPSIRLEGDEKRALAAIPVAKVLLQKVQSFLRRSGVTTFSASQAYGDDGSIYVLCTENQNIIHISVDHQVSEVETTVLEPTAPIEYPDLLSGIVVDGVIGPFVVEVDGEEKTVYKVKAFSPTPNCREIHDLPDGRQPSTRLVVRPWSAYSEWRAKSTDLRDFSQYQVPRPTWWSGKMKAVVQAVMGFGKLRKTQIPKNPKEYRDQTIGTGIQVRYDYKFTRTHGIHTAADGRLWLIEISINRGVLAMPLPIYPNSDGMPFRTRYANAEDIAMVAVLDELGCLPTGQAFPTLPATLEAKIASGDILRLMTPIELKPFYNCSGYSSICGWAFNDTGTQAHNTAYYYPDGDPIQRGVWYQININIGATATPRRAGMPIAGGAATLRLQSEGKLFSHPELHMYLPVFFYEPMLNPPGLLRHSAVPMDDSHVIPHCDTVVFAAIMNGELKTARFFASTVSAPPYATSDLDGECLYNSDFSSSMSTAQTIPWMVYTNDFDDRRGVGASTQSQALVSRRFGYSGAQIIELVDAPAWALVTRVAIFRNVLTTTASGGEQLEGALIVPGHSREAYYYMTGRRFNQGSTSNFSTYYTFVTDPNIGYAWFTDIGPEELDTPIGRLNAYTCGENLSDRRIVGTGYNASDDCADAADSGNWLSTCASVQTYVHAMPYMPPNFGSTNSGSAFEGRVTLVSDGLNGPITMPINEELWNGYTSVSEATGQAFFVTHSAIGEEGGVYTKTDASTGISGVGLFGYTVDAPGLLQACPCFIGATKL